jgi:peptide deformylase
MRDPDPPIGSAGTGSGGILAFINPYYVRKLGAGGIGKKKETEHCLSYPGISCEVERYAACELVYRDENWNVCQRQFSTFDARIVQHEMDHLDGVCRVGDFWRASQPPASSVPKKATVLA